MYRLVCVPPEIGMLLELKHLSIAHNMLEDVSKDIGNLSKLETVNFSHNRSELMREMRVNYYSDSCSLRWTHSMEFSGLLICRRQ
jgi:hypothetical protein